MDLSSVNPYIYGQAEKAANAGATIKKDLDKLDFLNLLVTQLQHQDPLDPMDDKEFVAQLAQFSSLEQLTNISVGIDDLGTAMTRQELINTASYIGKDITASGYSISKTGNETKDISEVYYEFDENVTSLQINVFDSSNNIIRTETFGGVTAGRYPYQWDGKNYKDEMQPDGVYNVYIAAFNENGQSVLVSTDVSGTVKAVQHANGQTWLALGDGRMVNFSNVSYVVDPNVGSTPPPEDP